MASAAEDRVVNLAGLVQGITLAVSALCKGGAP